MADNVEIQGLEFQIQEDSAQAVAGLERLAATLEQLKSAVSGGVSGLNTTAKQLERLNTALAGLDLNSAEKLTGLANGLRALGQIGQIRVSASIANQVTALAAALDNVRWTDGDKLAAMAQGLEPLTKLEKANLTSFLNQLSKLPAVIRELDQVDMEKFTRQMAQLAEAMDPLARGMEKVSGGFSSFPSQIQRASSALNKYSGTANSSKSGLGLGSSLLSGAKTAGIGISLQKVAEYLEDGIVKSNAYQENLNLFTAAMGEYAGEALKYGETVSEALGIDPSTWIRNQGVFNTLFTGFGNTADRAALMSKNLTQLGYDLSSFFNISVDQAMQKLQSGISGELEPLRRLGYDLSQTKLQLTAYNLGIEKKIQNMTQAEKAELRYHAILTQVTEAQGDMARTLEAPSNQIRILKAQFEMAARAIGNIFIPALNAILPYAIAVVQAIRQIAEALAGLFGFKLTEVDYSGVGDLAVDAGAAENALGGAAGAAKKLRDYTAGFDELNIFSPADAGGGGGAGGVGSGGGFDFELPEYDFLGDAMAKRVDEVKKKLEELLPLIAGIGAGLAAWEIAKKLLPELGTMQRLLGSLMVAVGVTLLVDSIQDIIVNGLTWQNILESAAGGAIAGAGLGLMLAKAMGLTWGKGMLLGAVVGLGVSLLIMAVTSEIAHGLDVGSVLLGVIGGAIAGAGIGAYLGKSVAGGLIGATVGIGISLLIMGIVSEVRDGVNPGNGILTVLGGVIAGAGIGIAIKGGIGGALLGATVGIGVTLVITGIISQVQEGVNAVGAILTVLGSVLTGAGIGFMIGGPIGAAAGAAIGLVVGIGLEFIGIEAAGKAAYEASEDFKVMENIIERSRETSERCAEAMGNLKTNVSNLDQVSSDFTAASVLVKEIFDINENANASNYELELMRVKVDVLNGMNIDGLHLSIDETTGRVIETRQEVEKLIESLQREAQMEAMKELLVQTYQDLAQAQIDSRKALEDYTTASEKLQETSEALANCPSWDVGRWWELSAAQKEQTEAVNAAQQAYAATRDTLDEIGGTIDIYSEQIAGMKLEEIGVGDEMVKGLSNVQSSLDEVAEGMDEYGKNIAEGLVNGIDENTQEAAYKGIWFQIWDWFTGLFDINSPSKLFYSGGEYISAGLLNGLSDSWGEIGNFFTEKTTDIKQTCSDAWDNVKAAAGEKWTNIKADLGNFWDGITGDASTKFTQTKEKIGSAWDGTKTDTSNKWSQIKTDLGAQWGGITNDASAKFNETRGKISEAWDGSGTDAASSWEQIGTSLGLDWDDIDKTAAEKFNIVANSIGSVWKDLITNAKDWGRDICGNIASGISGAVTTVTSAVSNVASSIRSFLHFSEPDVGPLSDFHTYMPDMMGLMAQGIRDNEDLAVDAVYDLTNSVADTFRRVSAQGMEFPVEETVAVRYEGNSWEDRRPDRSREAPDKVEIDNEEIIAALFAVGREIVTAINEKDSNTYLDGKQMMQAVEKHQRQRGANIMSGGVMP